MFFIRCPAAFWPSREKRISGRSTISVSLDQTESAPKTAASQQHITKQGKHSAPRGRRTMPGGSQQRYRPGSREKHYRGRLSKAGGRIPQEFEPRAIGKAVYEARY